MIDIQRLSYEEKKAIEELRLRVENALDPVLLEDFTLFYRFLKARDFDVGNAEKMLRKHISWRKAYQINTILEDFQPKEFYRKYIEPIYLGRDKKGDIVYYMAMGKMDGRDVAKCTTINEYMKHWMWHAEKQKADVKELILQGEIKVPQIATILNLDKLAIGNATSKSSLEQLIGMMSLLQDNYPEGMKVLYVINAPVYYVYIFSILKTMMSKAMLQKLHVYGRNGWKAKLLEDIDADILPEFLGGNRTDWDGDSRLKSIEAWDGKIPSIYYLPEEDRYFKDKAAVRKISVSRSGKKEVYIDVKSKESFIQWQFFIKNKDIGFGLFFEESDKVTELLPIQRYETKDGIEIGSYRLQSPGKYAIIFDNSYSWLNTKEIEYCVKAVEAGH